MSLLWLVYPLLGMAGGFIAGLFGVGGWLMLVPLLFMVFSAQGLAAEHQMHLALGTAMATIMFTSISSMRAHHAHGVVRWDIVRSMAPGLVVGTLAGTFIASHIPTRPLGVLFTVIVYYAAWQMAVGFTPKPSYRLPGRTGLFLAGLLIGGISSLVSAGGGFMSVPFMLLCHVAIHQAVGTSAALGFPIAVAGTLGYVLSGWQATGLPEASLGYVYVPALLGVVVMSVATAPLGARLAHRLPVKQLKRTFAGFLALLATKMLYGLLTG